MPTTVYRQLLLRRDLIANIPVLSEGEPFYATDTKELYVGTSGVNMKVDIHYSAAAPSNWTATPPSNLMQAMDRVAVALVALGVHP